ncbi:MAG TPA: TetR-like C-terminal domain-containing protein [Actinomycetota bacterium]|nr:TetR-like C-terminal domain-containing protein [Actinomycetota bacterium]
MTAATSTRAREAVAAGRQLLEEGTAASPCAAWPSGWASAPPRSTSTSPTRPPPTAGFALAHPHLYRLMNNGPLPRQHLPPGLEDRTAVPVLRVAGSQARALWAFAHGMVMLELDHRFPPDADLDRAWQAGIAAFQPA